ncbi:hypothetical protein B7463_g3462, partial [Scytalidium lignicola]
MSLHLTTGGAHSQPSLPSLPAHLQSDTHITAHLASRFHVSLPTALLSAHALISLNTYTSSTKGPDGGKEGSAMGGAEDLADRAWTRLGARSENQAVVFLGESGSGKTTIRAHLLTALLNKSSTPLSTKLSLASYVFDTLTTTKTATTPTASKAGLFYELQYDTASSVSPTLIGGKLLDHRLERSRVTEVPTGERNFHVLYYLLAGTSAAEKSHLGIDSPGLISDGNYVGNRNSQGNQHRRWRYLGHPTQLKVGINDAEGFQLFKTALRKLEFPRSEIAEICQVLAGILHIGQLEFEVTHDTTVTGDDSGGFSHEGGQTVTAVKNKEVLQIVAAFLGVSAQDLQITLGNKTKILHRERVTIMLDPKGARANSDELARTLYSLLVTYVMESINQRVCAEEAAISNTISIVDFPGFAQQASTSSVLDQLLHNTATEALYNFTLQSFFDGPAEMLESEEVTVPANTYFDNSDAVKLLLKSGNGLLSILDDQTRRNRTDLQLLESLRKRFDGKNPAITVGSATAKLPGSNFATHNTAAAFTVKHFAGEVDYQVTGLVEENGEVISGDLMNLISSTKSDFVAKLFGSEAVQKQVHPQERTTVMQAQVSSKPLRKPSVMRRKGDRPTRAGARAATTDTFDEASEDGISESRSKKHSNQGAAGQFLSSLDNVIKSLTAPNTNPYFVFCLKPNDRRIANQFDSKCVRTQVQTLGIAEISQRLRSIDYSIFLPFGEFLGLCEAESIIVGSEKEKVEMVLDEKRWPANEAKVGNTGIFLSERCWSEIAKLSEKGFVQGRYPAPSDDGEGGLTPGGDNGGGYGTSKERLLQGQSPGDFAYGNDKKSGYFGSQDIDARSDAGASALGQGDMFRNLDTRAQMAEKGNEKTMVEVEEVETSSSRKRWLLIVNTMTWLIPDAVIRMVGRMPRKDIRMAWREKLAINMMIWQSCLFVAFMIVIFPLLLCPRQHVYSPAELTSHDGKHGHSAYVAIRGIVFDLGDYVSSHYPRIIPEKSLLAYAGLDATSLFPIQVSALCQGTSGSINEFVQLDYTNTNTSGSAQVISATDTNPKYHDFRAFTNDSRPDWFYEQMLMLKAGYKVGNVGYTAKYLKTLANKQSSIASLNGRIYDFTNYVTGGRRVVVPQGKPTPSNVNTDFMNQLVVDLFQQKSGDDITKYWNALALSTDERQRMQICLDNLFYVGNVDTRNSVKCQFSEYLMLAVSIVLLSVIGFKFLAALQFGGKNIPENLDKFIMCQVPAYTEDEDSIRRAIDSAARMKYDDKRKLLVIVCDGMIIGQGNDRPTPRIVLDILGVSETVDPEPLSFESLGEGAKQHNMGKVYSGLYEVQGHIVPFLVIVKVGKPSEVTRPGNRGKRDSQMIMMRFLNRIHYNAPMSPLELEMYHQIRNIIGVNPAFYEYMLQIDADTVVAPDSASRMVSAFLDDTNLIGVCGETALTNAKSSFITMIQVYEYYISHNLSKAFESLFGSVTCLPGCFTMYRIRAHDSGKPLFVSKEVVEGYSTIRVDTLHMKNLLHLGEDRFLTTLLLKHHAKYKTKFIFDAHAWTIAPDSWKVFLSQRRRWINSTVHNLVELIPMDQLCGFCCFSMRFVVFIDLLSTVIQPITVAYIVYLIVTIVRNPSSIPITAFILLGVIYGLQAIIFILRRKWEMVGWMLMYIAAIPVFSFALPLYSFWHMDDFSWGNTRVVTGEKGRAVVITDEGVFDPSSIPHKKWEEYQAQLWEGQTQRDDRSEVSGYSYATKSHYPQSEYNYPASRPMSQMPLPSYPYDAQAPNLYNSTSRMSLAPSEMGNVARMSHFGGSQHELEMANLAGLPNDDAILAEIRDILKTADLMTITKKSIKQELERRFNVNLDARRAYINSATEALLSEDEHNSVHKSNVHGSCWRPVRSFTVHDGNTVTTTTSELRLSSLDFEVYPHDKETHLQKSSKQQYAPCAPSFPTQPRSQGTSPDEAPWCLNQHRRYAQTAYMAEMKQNHCTPTCAMPSNPAAHSNALTVLQHATSARDAGWTNMFAKAEVLDVVPRRTKYGEIPSEVAREMILFKDKTHLLLAGILVGGIRSDVYDMTSPANEDGLQPRLRNVSSTGNTYVGSIEESRVRELQLRRKSDTTDELEDLAILDSLERSESNYFKSAQWYATEPPIVKINGLLNLRTADGSTLLTSSADNTIRTFILPPNILDALDDPNSVPEIAPYTIHSHPTSINCVAPYPHFSLSDTSTTLYLSTPTDLPIRLNNSLSGTSSIYSPPLPVSTYLLVSPTTEAYLTPSSLQWTHSGSHFLTGTDCLIALFDASNNGGGPITRLPTIPSKRHKLKGGGVGIRGIVSALSMQPNALGTGDAILAAGTWTRYVGLYDAGGLGGTISTFSVADAADSIAGIGGSGITQTVWSPCGRYLIAVERKSMGALCYDVRVAGKLLSWIEGRKSDTNQRLGLDVFEGPHGMEVWAGGTDGYVNIWYDLLRTEGAITPSWSFSASKDPIGSTVIHSSGVVVATCSGQRTSGKHIAENEDDDESSESDLSEGQPSDDVWNTRMSDNSLKVWAV